MRNITAIIPVYNSEICIERAINSALHQEHPFLEIIVINDGSTDRTGEIVKAMNGPIRFFEQENQGQGAARNLGLKHARGDYIAFLDADDYWLPDFTKVCLQFLEENADAVAVSTGWRIKHLSKSDSVFPASEIAENSPVPTILKDFFCFWGKYDHVRTGTVLIRREVIESNGYQLASLRISQDLEFWCFIATCGPWGFIPTVHWVGDSETMAASSGWLNKYRIRRRNCPTIDEWQLRVLPRIESINMRGFKQVRGRVALGYTHSHLVGGDKTVAWDIVTNYAEEMPSCWSSNLLKLGVGLGSLGRGLVRFVFLLREYQKTTGKLLSKKGDTCIKN